MVKYPLSKEPISAEVSANEITKAEKNIEEVFKSLKSSYINIQNNLEGEEFQAAASYIGELLKDIDNAISNIYSILQELTYEVNVYNSQITDADGNPYYTKDIN